LIKSIATLDNKSPNPFSFADRLLEWFDKHGRHDLPWQKDISPYRVWISEIMLQQTQVSTVIPYFERFLSKFPTIEDLAAAKTDQVLHLWTGLGYYARARNLHHTSQMITENFGGIFPSTVEELETLKGIGKSTAGAIAAISMDVRAPILDGNVKRVLARYRAIDGWPGHTAVSNLLWDLAEELLPSVRVASYTQAIMDLGATVCVRSNPACDICPLRHDCLAYQDRTTENFPGRKPTKEVPIRSIAMFILTNENHQVLLYKRPPDGIWGSLYSLPESPDPRTVPQLGSLGSESNNEAIDIKQAIVMDPIRHTFSHFHLDIQPIRLAINPDKLTVGDSDEWFWYPLNQSVEVGLAAPVKRLLSQIGPQ
tara:strand:+ start:557 stop:1660 length:1104 start_codon:yes stop_codon:yes gene_type:complete